MLLKRSINIGIRGLIALSRFVLLAALSKLLSVSDVGVFGLFVAVLVLFVFITGFEFRSFAFRELSSSQNEQQKSKVFENYVKSLVVFYLIALFAQLFLPISTAIDRDFLPWFLLLHFLVYFSTEIERYLIVLNRQIEASLIVFFQTSVWVYLYIFISYFDIEFRNLSSVFLFWSIGGLVSIFLGVFFILKSVHYALSFSLKGFDFLWVKQGLKVGFLLFSATVLQRILLTMDRLIVDYLGTSSDLGVYVFYIGISIAAFNLLQASVFSFSYPKMLFSRASGHISLYRSQRKELVTHSVLFALTIGICLYVFSPVLFEWLSIKEYTQSADVFPWFILVGFVNILGRLFQYDLYFQKYDKEILLINLLGVAIFSIFFYIVDFFDLLGIVERVLASLFVAMTSMLGLKFYISAKLSKLEEF